MAFLNDVGDRKTIMPEPCGEGDHQPHVRSGDLVERALILRVTPADRQFALFVAFEERRDHGGLYELSANAGQLHHRRLLNLDLSWLPRSERVQLYT